MARTIEHKLWPRDAAIDYIVPHYCVYKDADYEIREQWMGDEDLTGGSITWMIVAESADLSGDLDSVSTELSLSTGGGTVAITDGTEAVFTCTIADGDTASIAPGRFLVIPRITLSGGDILISPKYPIFIGA